MSNFKIVKVNNLLLKQQKMRKVIAKKAAELKEEYNTEKNNDEIQQDSFHNYSAVKNDDYIYEADENNEIDHSDVFEEEEIETLEFDESGDETVESGESADQNQGLNEIKNDCVSEAVNSLNNLYKLKTQVQIPENIPIDNEFICEQLAKLAITLEEIRQDQKKILNLLENSNKTNNSSIDLLSKDLFPIKIISEVYELEKKCDNPEFARNLEKYVERFKMNTTNLTKSNHSCFTSYGLSQMFSDSILHLFNWDGSKSKRAFSLLIKLNNVLYGAWKSETMTTFAQYASNIRAQLHGARCRVNQKHKRNRDSRLKNDINESESCVKSEYEIEYI